jgi:hypothetical protein
MLIFQRAKIEQMLSCDKNCKMTIRNFEAAEELLERLQEELDVSSETLMTKLDELSELGFLESILVDEQYRFGARQGVEWEDFVHIDDPVKKQILLYLVENPKTFFVLYNTQKGKLRIAADEIKAWSRDEDFRVVAFVIVDNDKTLADQSSDGLQRRIGSDHAEIFTLSSNNKTSVEFLERVIDAYEFNPDHRKMPVIACLGNDRQIQKILSLMYYIQLKVRSRGSKLRIGNVWDEADKVYPLFRNKKYSVHGTSIGFLDIYNCEKPYNALHRLGFVTATDGDLLETQDYPECANAYQYPIVMDEYDARNYRAFHHSDSIIHEIPFDRDSSNGYAFKIIEKNADHFATPVVLKDGTSYFRKIIVNSNAKSKDMSDFAIAMVRDGSYAITFNMYGLRVYTPSGEKSYRVKGKRFNELLFYAYKKNNLHDRPLYIIGRRKVDRGLGFHYAPRNATSRTHVIEGVNGPLETDDVEGLIWTDEILGRIDDVATAVQKAGRGAGIIAQCPQYSGSFHYWCDPHTSHEIKRHNTIVDATNREKGGNSILQAKLHAKSKNPLPPKVQTNHETDTKKFRVYGTEKDMREACAILGYVPRLAKPREDGFIETSVCGPSHVVEVLEAIRKLNNLYGGKKEGTSAMRVCIPCYADTSRKETLCFVVPIKPTTTDEELENLDKKVLHIPIPMRGEFAMTAHNPATIEHV